MHIAKKIAYILVIIGALNWGLYGISGYDLVDVIFGQIPMIASIVYVLVGLSALLLVFSKHKNCCSKDACQCDIPINTPSETK
jgi:uncharacterized protein